MKTVRALMDQAVREKVFPGGVLLLGTPDKIVFHEAFGLARIRPERKTGLDTVFDLASLTKPLAVALVMMGMAEKGRLSPSLSLGETLPEFAQTPKAKITLAQLLCHTSGFPACRPYSQSLSRLPEARRRAGLMRLLVDEPLLHPPGEKALYSDLGFLVLQMVLEKATQKPLDILAHDLVFSPLGIKDLFFPGMNPPFPRERFAATEDCPWRGRVLCGEVDDRLAWVLGGVAGHSGLFGTAQGVWQAAAALVSAYSGKQNKPAFGPGTARRFLARTKGPGSFALGFDTPTRPESSSGQYFSDDSVGHLGFTGTSFWVDLEKKCIVVLLTNRIHPNRDNEGIKAFRPLVHDAAMRVFCREIS